MDFKRFRGQNAWQPVPPCGGLCRPVAPDWIPLILRFQILEAWIWRPGAWMPGCWKDWNGLEEVTEVTAFWGEGIGRNSHTLKLQELGGYLLLSFSFSLSSPCPSIAQSRAYSAECNLSCPQHGVPKGTCEYDIPADS